jgi:GR25 family glycosyltransferase involved in LPS biosynthesis
MNKLEGFPNVYYLSLHESEDRRHTLYSQFHQYGIQDVKGVLSKRFAETNDIIEGDYVHTLTDQSKGSIISHMRALDHWLKTTNDEYVFICEDDVSFETVPYWDFTWKDFISSLPNDWEVVQLLVVRDDFENKFEFRNRYWNDWALAAYMIRRDYAQSLVNRYCIGEKFVFNTEKDGILLQPIGENVIYTPSNHCYSIPLFVEEVYKFNTTLEGVKDFDGNKDGYEMVEGQGKSHITSYHDVLNWYQKNSSVSLNQLMNTEVISKKEITSSELIEYALDPENALKNFNLARWYHNQGQTASAISYYLRAADRAEDKLLAYESLILSSHCFDRQGNRNVTVYSLLRAAVTLLPQRPEAYYFWAKKDESNGAYSECYTTCSLALALCDFNAPSLRNNVGYDGKYMILFEKAVSAFMWGKTQETKEILLDLLENYEMDDTHRESCIHNLRNLGVEI